LKRRISPADQSLTLSIIFAGTGAADNIGAVVIFDRQLQRLRQRPRCASQSYRL
jgi:hypothetical protein